MRRLETAPRPSIMKFGTKTKQHLFALLDANSDFNRGEIAIREPPDTLLAPDWLVAT